jgi:hypothetical protein
MPRSLGACDAWFDTCALRLADEHWRRVYCVSPTALTVSAGRSEQEEQQVVAQEEEEVQRILGEEGREMRHGSERW